jgi:hypothetical protein
VASEVTVAGIPDETASEPRVVRATTVQREDSGIDRALAAARDAANPQVPVQPVDLAEFPLGVVHAPHQGMQPGNRHGSRHFHTHRLAPGQGEAAPVVPARLCLRGGFRCFNRIARTMGFDIPEEPDQDAGTSVTYAEFLDAVGRMREVGFPIERDPAEAWPDFVGWRVNYEAAAYAVAAAVYAVPALWSGPRRHPVSPIPPIRPGRGHPPK